MRISKLDSHQGTFVPGSYVGYRIGVHQAHHQELVYYFTPFSETFSKVRSHGYHARYDVTCAVQGFAQQ